MGHDLTGLSEMVHCFVATLRLIRQYAEHRVRCLASRLESDESFESLAAVGVAHGIFKLGGAFQGGR